MQSRTVCVALIQGPAPWSNEPRGCPQGQGQMGSSLGNFLHSQFSSPLPNPQLQPLPRYFPHFSLPTHGPLSPVSLSFNRKAPSNFSCGTTMDQNQLLEFPHIANHPLLGPLLTQFPPPLPVPKTFHIPSFLSSRTLSCPFRGKL